MGATPPMGIVRKVLQILWKTQVSDLLRELKILGSSHEDDDHRVIPAPQSLPYLSPHCFHANAGFDIAVDEGKNSSGALG